MKCPNCGSEEVVLITYGQPPFFGARLEKAIREKTVILGGCALCGDAPAYGCRKCDHRFDPPKPERKRRFFGR